MRAVLSELAALPYENLSKIVAYHRSGRAETAQDISSRWLDDPARAGVGGTCFSLTHWLKTRLENLGHSTAYLMADKRIAPNIHCGLLFEHEGRSYLLDPGYLIFEPLLLPDAGRSLTTWVSPNEIRLQDVSDEGVWRLFTGQRAGSHAGPHGPPGTAPLKHRFDFRKQSVDAPEFERHWEASHHWEMMRYPVLNRVQGGVQYYLQKSSLLIRSPSGGEMKKLTGAEVREAACGLFGLPPELVDEALRLLS